MINKSDYHDKVIWIIGASSGIGEALARELDERGASLALSARRKDELDTLRDSLKSLNHRTHPIDVSDASLVSKTASEIRSHFGRIDSVIFLAASYTPMKLSNLDLDITKQIIDINLLGAFHVIQAVVPILTAQTHGQIALCGSVAGYIGLPGGQPYSATKAGIINLAESLRSELDNSIDIKLISPGFVKTSLTDKNKFPMPMIIEPKLAAKKIADGLLKKNFEIHFPKLFTSLLKILQILPYGTKLNITRKFNR